MDAKKKIGRPRKICKVIAPASAESERTLDDGLKIRLYRLVMHLKKLRDSNLEISMAMPRFSADAEIAKARAQSLDLAVELADFYIEKGGIYFRKEMSA